MATLEGVHQEAYDFELSMIGLMNPNALGQTPNENAAGEAPGSGSIPES